MNPGSPETDARLDQLLAAVPRAIEPPADHWPAIRRRLDRGARGARPWLAVAASALLVVIAGALAHQAARAPIALRVAGGPVTGSTPVLDVATREREARASLVRAFGERLALLAPPTRARIEQNLAIIRAASEDIRRALPEDPNSAILQDLLQGADRQELDLYQQVVQSTDPFVRRT